MNFCTVGHVTLDVIDQQKQTGGSVLFNSALAYMLGHKSSVVTSSSVDFPYVEYSNIEFSIQFSAKTTLFEHEYVDGSRHSNVLQKADEILDSSIPKFLKNSNVVMLSPILDEVLPETINLFSTQWIGLTPQGWFREMDKEGKVAFCESKFKTLPKKIKLIVVSHEDLQNDPSAWEWICASTEIAVQTMGAQGYILCMNGQEKKYEPTQVFNEINPTGCGDIFSTAGMLALYKGIDPIQAFAWAGHAAGLASTQNILVDSIQIASRFLSTKF